MHVPPLKFEVGTPAVVDRCDAGRHAHYAHAAALPSGDLLYYPRIARSGPGLLLATRRRSADAGATCEVSPLGTEVRFPEEVEIDPGSRPSYWGQSEIFVYQYGMLVERVFV